MASLPLDTGVELARTLPAGFGVLASRGKWVSAKHLTFISLVIARAHARCPGFTRIILLTPPRHGKSSLVSQYTPAWWLGKSPDERVLLTSYSDRFAALWGRRARDVFWEYAPQVFGLHPRSSHAATDDWGIAGHTGTMATAGTGGTITGRGADLLIVDDPVKDAAAAESESNRERIWDWWQSTASSRLEPNGVAIVVMCMTGDTPVLAEDGTEKPLREIRVGDRVATVDETGEPSSSVVVNWASQGHDTVYEVRMTSGRKVRANARHPFRVIHDDGEVAWVRLESLRAGMRVRSVEAPTAVSSAQIQSVGPLQNARVCACATTTRPAGHLGIGHRHSTAPHAEPFASRVDMESLASITTACSQLRAGDAPSAESSHMRPDVRNTGPMFSALTTITPVEPCADCFATIATSLLDEPERLTSFARPSPTWRVGADEIGEIVACGIEEVFDIEVERDHNFIANGLEVSNTHWHQDDLAGRLIQEMKNGGEQWTVIKMPAIATRDEVWRDDTWTWSRQVGEALWPKRFDAERLEAIRKRSGQKWWNALYQQEPAPPEGSLSQRQWFPIVRALPSEGLVRCRFWDCASTEQSAQSRDPDWTVGALVAWMPSKKVAFIEHVIRVRMTPGAVDDLILQTAKADGVRVRVREEEEGGSSGVAIISARKKKLAGYNYKGVKAKQRKQLNWTPFLIQAEGGNIAMLEGDWNRAFLDEATTVPAGHDDQMDAVAGAYNELALSVTGATPGVW